MLKYITALLLTTAVVAAQPFPPREGPVIIAPTGGGSSSSGGLNTNEIISLIQQYGGGGGLVSNANNLTFTSLTVYTNTTPYRLSLNVLVQERGATANGLSVATLDIDTHPDGAFDYTRIFSLASSATFTNSTMITHTIEPGYAWRITTSGGAAITSAGGQLLYFSTNSSSGGGGGSGDVLATDVANIVSTNNGLSYPEHVNAGYSQRFIKSIYDLNTATILNYGDNQINITASLWRNFDLCFSNRVAGPTFGSSAFSYRTAAGINTLYRTADCLAAGLLPFFTYGLGNGGSYTNRHISDQGFPTENIIVNYYASNNFGSYTIRTQQLGGAIGDFRTVSANNAGAFALRYTNWTIPRLDNLIVSVVSSGTNIIIGIGQTLTNSNNQTWSWDDYEDQGVRLSDFTATTTLSNFCGQFFASNRIDVMFVHDLYTSGVTTSNDWYFIQGNFQNCLSNYNVLTDVIYFTPAPIYTTSLSTNTLDQRNGILAASRAYSVRAFDAYRLMLPVLRSLTNQLYWTVDNLHLSNSANAYVVGQFAETFGFSPGALASIKSVFLDKASLAGGNTFSGAQNYNNSSLTVTNGNIQFQRSGGSYTRLVGPSSTSIFSVLDSGSGDAVIFGLTNTFGTVTMGGVGTTTLGGPNWTYLGTFSNPTITGAIGGTPALNGLNVTNVQATNIVFSTNFAPVNAVTPVLWITNVQYGGLIPVYR